MNALAGLGMVSEYPSENQDLINFSEQEESKDYFVEKMHGGPPIWVIRS